MKVNKRSSDFTNFDIGATKEAQANASAIEEATSKKYDVVHIPLEDIIFNPINTRFNDEDTDETIQELVDNLRDSDLLNPIIVVPHDDKYMLVSGERRTKAFKKLNRRTIPAMIRPVSDELEIMEMLYEANLQSRILSPKTRFLAFRDLYREYQKRSKTINTAEMARKLSLSAATVKKYRTLLEEAEDGDLVLLECDEIDFKEFKKRTMDNLAKKAKKENDAYKRRIALITRDAETITATNYIDPVNNTVYSVERDDAGKYCTAVTDSALYKVPLHFQNQVFETPEEAQMSLDIFARTNNLPVYTGDFSEYRRQSASTLSPAESSVMQKNTQSNDQSQASEEINAEDFGPSLLDTVPTQQIGGDSHETYSDESQTDDEIDSESEVDDEDLEDYEDSDDSDSENDVILSDDKEDDKEDDNEIVEEKDKESISVVRKNETSLKSTANNGTDYLGQLAVFSGYSSETKERYTGSLYIDPTTGRTYIIVKLDLAASKITGAASKKTDAYYFEVEPRTVIRNDYN